jgi:hypothetical protein
MEQLKKVKPFQILRDGAIVILATSVVLTGVCLFKFDSLSDAAAYVKGRRIVVTPSTIEVPPGSPGQPRMASCVVKNLGESPVQLIGSNACCECTLTKGTRARIEPGESQVLEFSLILKEQTSYSRVVKVYTDNSRVPEFHVQLKTVR